MESMEQLNHITGTCMRLYFVYIQYCLHNYWRTYSSQEWNSSPWIDSETRSNLAQWWIGDSNTTPISRTRREKCIAAEKGICLAPEPKRTWPSQSMNERVHHNAFKSQNVPVCLPVAMKRCIECSDGTKHAPMTAKTMDSVWWLQKVELSDHCESSQFTQTKRRIGILEPTRERSSNCRSLRDILIRVNESADGMRHAHCSTRFLVQRSAFSSNRAQLDGLKVHHIYMAQQKMFGRKILREEHFHTKATGTKRHRKQQSTSMKQSMRTGTTFIPLISDPRRAFRSARLCLRVDCLWSRWGVHSADIRTKDIWSKLVWYQIINRDGVFNMHFFGINIFFFFYCHY